MAMAVAVVVAAAVTAGVAVVVTDPGSVGLKIYTTEK
jgi:hypothetical protein